MNYENMSFRPPNGWPSAAAMVFSALEACRRGYGIHHPQTTSAPYSPRRPRTGGDTLARQAWASTYTTTPQAVCNPRLSAFGVVFPWLSITRMYLMVSDIGLSTQRVPSSLMPSTTSTNSRSDG